VIKKATNRKLYTILKCDDQKMNLYIVGNCGPNDGIARVRSLLPDPRTRVPQPSRHHGCHAKTISQQKPKQNHQIPQLTLSQNHLAIMATRGFCPLCRAVVSPGWSFHPITSLLFSLPYHFPEKPSFCL
jgi:hypothetical protein